MIVALLVVGVIGLIKFAFYRLSRDHARYYEERNLKYNEVSTTLRNVFYILLKKIELIELIKQTYNRFPDE